MNAHCKHRIRQLYNWEIQEARLVFANKLNYERVRIHECASFPDIINRLGTRFKGLEYTGKPNAITLGDHCYFPIKLPERENSIVTSDLEKIGWLIHELCHTWQYQHMGWRYLKLALETQLRLKDKAYDFGGKQGLITRHKQGGRLKDFNLEQQGDIVRSYYERFRQGLDTSAWLPFIVEIQQDL
jgi:type VI secretion system secreted protein VgrG